ncbi:DMT family transporter [Haladaptatus salinisoli]|uniref:DMT family transporter n=1 Tax=Haladaptatus salinisoli TaxID=2884876 RepID=UPI001D0BB86D|nr:DMT family transporter [Haladaptatus salinisoli]
MSVGTTDSAPAVAIKAAARVYGNSRMDTDSPRVPTVALFLLVTVLFGTAFPAIEVGLAFLPPLLFAAARYYVSAAVLLAYALLATDRWRPRTRGDRTAIAAGGVLFIGGTGFTFLGQQFTTGGIAAVIVSLSPILTALLGWVLLPDERLSARGFLGVVVGFVGVTIVVDPTPASLLDRTSVGRLLILLATVVVTLGTVLVRRSRPTVAVPALTGWSMLVGASIQLAVAVALGESPSAVEFEPAAVATVAYLGVLAGAVAFLGYFTLLERAGALEANLVTYVNPVVALVVGRALLREPVSATVLVGFFVILAGFALLKNKELAATVSKYRGPGR